MPKNRVFGRPMPDANVPRNAFDWSKRITMNMPFGALIPCYAHQAIAGSRFQIAVDSFFRTGAVNTAAFPRLKMETEFFCVPLRYLWSYWDNFKLGITDYHSTSLMNATDGSFITPSTVPSVDVFNDLWSLLENATSLDPLSYDWKYGARRLADMLGYGRYNSDFASQFDSSTVQKMSLFKIAAYQKVYYDHFRNTAYEANDPFAYNLDAITTTQGYSASTQLSKLFTLRYVNYRKDYFQSIFPGLNFISQNGTDYINNTTIPSWVQGLNSDGQEVTLSGSTGFDTNSYQQSQDGINWSQQTSVGTAKFVNGVNGVSIEAGGTPLTRHSHTLSQSVTLNLDYNVQQIRAAFALDKLNRAAAYAPQHVKNQYEARYGIKFPASASYESQKIGSFDTDIVIGEVTSVANTDTGSTGDALGAIGGKGIGSRNGGNMISFDVKEDSIIIGVCYAIPRTSYDSYRFDTWNMKLNRTDFFLPEFMNLGLKPLYQKEFQVAYYDSSLEQYKLRTSYFNYPLGYQLPYMEYKTDVDENHGLFADVDSDLGQFVIHSNSGISASSNGVTARYFKVKPSDLDTIFVAQADGTESTDHLFGELTFHIPVNQNMSVHGIPSL